VVELRDIRFGPERDLRSTSSPALAEALRLIVITDEGMAHPRRVEDVVEASLRAGVRSIQLRDKRSSARDLLERARALKELTTAWGALLFINDRFDVALASGADGVHLGPHDLPVELARGAAPHPFLIGYSTDEPDTAREAVQAGANYIGCGAVFPTQSKKDAGEVIGIRGLDRVAQAVDVPVVGIGGVNPPRAARIATETRATGVAVIGSVMAAPDPGQVVQELLEPFQKRSRPP
jgi:thiamine-phosphate diphosphorylase